MMLTSDLVLVLAADNLSLQGRRTPRVEECPDMRAILPFGPVGQGPMDPRCG